MGTSLICLILGSMLGYDCSSSLDVLTYPMKIKVAKLRLLPLILNVLNFALLVYVEESGNWCESLIGNTSSNWLELGSHTYLCV
jgi:hypothetical protein